MRIVFLDQGTFQRSDEYLDYSYLEKLGEFIVYDETSDAQLEERVQHADVVVTIGNDLFAKQLESFSHVKLICKAGSGYDRIDITTAKARGIGVCNLPGYGTYMVAQWTWNFILALASNSIAYDRDIRKKQNWDHLSFMHRITELRGKTLGLVGHSHIAKQVAAWALAFEMNVLVYSRFPDPTANKNVKFVDLLSLAEQSDFVSIHARLDQQTRGMIGRDFMSRMRPSSYLINTARAAIVDENVLMEYLSTKKIAGAALDVFWQEPLPDHHPLYQLDHVILTPHMAWGSLETRQRMIEMLRDAIVGYFSGKPIYLIQL
jgi:glycerate dehydrogenase